MGYMSQGVYVWGGYVLEPGKTRRVKQRKGLRWLQVSPTQNSASGILRRSGI